MAEKLVVGMILFPRLALLDLAGPYEVFARMPGAQVKLAAATAAPVRSDLGMVVQPDTLFDQAGSFDVLFVPGGFGQVEMMEDQRFISFLGEQGRQAAWITSVCTGALLLGAAGLLKGYRATTHWLSLDLLAMLGAEPVAERVVTDRNRITGAGVSAGIDLALVIAGRLCGEEAAREIQLAIEYDPQPPYAGGSPRSADPALVERIRAARAPFQQKRREQIARVNMP